MKSVLPFFVKSHVSVAEIDFDALRRQGISCVLFDAEGTLTPWRGVAVSANVSERLSTAGIRKIGIVSNMPQKHIKRAQEVGRQVGAGVVMVPSHSRVRKPSPAMVFECLQTLAAEPSETVLIGDKLIDVLTARNAGLAGAIWVDVMPGPDHWFDKYIYRSVEPIFKKRYIKRYKPQGN